MYSSHGDGQKKIQEDARFWTDTDMVHSLRENFWMMNNINMKLNLIGFCQNVRGNFKHINIESRFYQTEINQIKHEKVKK